MSLKSDTEGDHELMNRPTQSLYKDRLPPLPDLPILKLLTHTALASKSKKHNLKSPSNPLDLSANMRLAYLILSVFVATVAAVPNQCTPNGLPCDSQTPCCSKVCVIQGDIGSPNENGTCE
ncbi:hypothetical protein AFCA_001313 [Aspergillus flavus]|nr:hypothetical protein AFLA_003768 [Aspergillus flavus NRRL3357]UCK58457.1 hypothetical protein AFCA_001313 [Aspergillus flavus]